MNNEYENYNLDEMINKWNQRTLEDNIKIYNGKILNYDVATFRKAVGNNFYNCFFFHEINKVKVNNLIFITCKDLEKTSATKKYQWLEMNRYPWLNCFDLKNTIDNAEWDLTRHHRNNIGYLIREYGVTDAWKKIKEHGNGKGFELLRAKNNYKGNQRVEFLSFWKMVQTGGFTTNNGMEALFHFEELQDPSSITKELEGYTRAHFEFDYKLINNKNINIARNSGIYRDPNAPKNIFTSNRFSDSHPLTEFAEEHFPWNTTEELFLQGKIGVRDWMLKDPINNNFIVHYVKQANKGWEFLNCSLIIYANQFASERLFKNNPAKFDELVGLVKNGNQQDLAVILGDKFEGYDVGDNALHFKKRKVITEEEFNKDYAKYVIQLNFGIDIDLTRQIVISPIATCSKIIISKINEEESNIYRLIRLPIIVIPTKSKVSDDGKNTSEYLDEVLKILNAITEKIVSKSNHFEIAYIRFDDPRANWPDRINYGDKQQNHNLWNVLKVNFSKKWEKLKRCKDIDSLQDTETIIDIKHYSLDNLHRIFNKLKVGFNGKIIEKYRDKDIDVFDSNCYALYDSLIYYDANINATTHLGGYNEW